MAMSQFMVKRLLPLSQIRTFSSSENTLSTFKSLKRSSFTIDYLTSSCGLTPKRALLVSKHVYFEKADKPNSVLAFFKDQGFTQTQISKIITSFPALLTCNPEKTYLPKIEFLKSIGILGSEVGALVSRSPTILGMSLENSLIPSFDFFRNFIQSEEKTNAAFKRFLRFPISRFGIYMLPNIEKLKQAGVPVRYIKYTVIYQPHVLLTNCNKYRLIIEKVKNLGFNPLKVSFLVAIQAFISMNKSTWDRKTEAYKRWGWSDNDILNAFMRFPKCMTLSEDKINSVMEFLVNEMGLKSSFIAQRPYIFAYSLDKRIVPRCIVYQTLVSKGLIKPSDTGLTTIIQYSEKCFILMIIELHKDEAPDILKLYKQKLDLAK